MARMPQHRDTKDPCLCRHVTASGVPGCLPSDQPVESYHNMIRRLKLLHYRSSMEVFLDTTLSRMVYLSALDLYSPIKRRVDIWSAASLKAALHFLEAVGPEGEPIKTICWFDEAEALEYGETINNFAPVLQNDPETTGIYSVYVVNDSEHSAVSLSKNRVCSHLPAVL